MQGSPFKIISVFADEEYSCKGNTAAVVHLNDEISAEQMQQTAADFNQPATSFLWEADNKLHVRWFAPDGEIHLCGHGSLAVFYFLNMKEKVDLHYNGGVISGEPDSTNGYGMKMAPIISEKASKPDDAILKGTGLAVKEYFYNENKNIVLVENENQVRNMKPDFGTLKHMEPFGIIVTAPGDKVDFVSRTLVPKVQQLEDHATGSSHSALTPFWSDRLQKSSMSALQLSPRGGKFTCEYNDDIVTLSGKSYTLCSGQLS